MPLEVRHGELIDVLGHPVRFDGCTLVPALVELAGSSFSSQFDLNDWCAQTGTSMPLIVHRDTNAPWVLGRLMRLFNVENTPEDERDEKCCFRCSFLAVLHELGDIAIPFEVFDVYARTSLWFSEEDPPALDHRQAIAKAFYGLLLDEPDSLEDYQNRLLHQGAGVWIDFGVSGGEPFFSEGEQSYD